MLLLFEVLEIMNIRPRRNRKNVAIRDMVQETHLSVDNLIYPLFLVDGENQKSEISSLPGNFRWTLDLLLKEIEDCVRLGIRTFVLFPVVDEKLKEQQLDIKKTYRRN